jgi:hypothetical protein
MGVNDVRTTSGVFWRIGSEMAAARSPPEPPKWSCVGVVNIVDPCPMDGNGASFEAGDWMA